MQAASVFAGLDEEFHIFGARLVVQMMRLEYALFAYRALVPATLVMSEWVFVSGEQTVFYWKTNGTEARTLR